MDDKIVLTQEQVDEANAWADRFLREHVRPLPHHVTTPGGLATTVTPWSAP